MPGEPMVEFEIVTPEGVVASGSAAEVIVPGSEGAFGVLPGHIPFASTITQGYMTVKSGGKAREYFVAGGFVLVRLDRVQVCVREGVPREVKPDAA